VSAPGLRPDLWPRPLHAALRLRRPGSALLAGLLLTACEADGPPPGQEHSSESPHWSYAGDYGPDRWAALDESFETCGTGRDQSPIDLAGAVASQGSRVDWSYDAAALEVSFNELPADLVDNGHTVQVSYPGGSLLHLVDGDYELAQFHFHAPSEHTVDGAHFPLEVHLVHVGPEGRLAVVGVFVTPGEAHEELAAIAENLPRPGETRYFEDVVIDVNALVPSGPGYYAYDGSLTTPPCSEGVQWFVMETPLSAAPTDIETIAAAVDGNNRPVQATGNRTIALVRHERDE